MRYLIFLALGGLLLARSTLAGGDYALTGYPSSYPTSFNYEIVHKVTITSGPVDYVLRWIPLPRVSSYDDVWQQTPTQTGIIDTDPPAQIYYNNGVGAWVFWGDGEETYYGGQVLRCTVTATVNVTLNMDGDFPDVILDNATSWTDYSPRSPYISAASAVADQLRNNYVAGTCRGGYGFAHRVVQYISDTITYDDGTSYEDNAADVVWAQERGTCSGFANLFISMTRSEGVGAAFMMGNTFAASFSLGGGGMLHTVDGAHSWSAADNGTWLPMDPAHDSVGWCTTSRVLEAQAVDQSDVNIQTNWGGAGTIAVSRTFSGGGGGESFVEHERWDNGGHDLFVHRPDSAQLRPLGSEPTVGIPNDQYLNPSIEHAIWPMGNPSFRRVQLALSLLKPAKQMDVEILDIRGRSIDYLKPRPGREGDNFISWTPDWSVPSGIYFARISFDEGRQVVTQKVAYFH